MVNMTLDEVKCQMHVNDYLTFTLRTNKIQKKEASARDRFDCMRMRHAGVRVMTFNQLTLAVKKICAMHNCTLELFHISEDAKIKIIIMPSQPLIHSIDISGTMH